MQRIDFSEILSAYATHLAETRGFAEGTCKAYVAAARELLELLQARPHALLLPADAGLDALDRRALEIHLNHLRDARGWRPATLAAHLRGLRALFEWLLLAGHVSADPTHGLRIGTEPNPTPLPEGDEARIHALFEQAGPGLAGARLGLLLELIYGGGMKPIAAYGVQALQCDAAKGVARLRAAQGNLELPLTGDGLARAEAYLGQRRAVLERMGEGPEDEAPFWIGARGRGLGATALGKQVRAAMERAGFSGGAAALRRLAARHFRDRGADLRSLQRFLGARRLGGLSPYGQADFRRVAEELRRIHPRREPD
jgi:site-specific recombinase XerD